MCFMCLLQKKKTTYGVFLAGVPQWQIWPWAWKTLQKSVNRAFQMLNGLNMVACPPETSFSAISLFSTANKLGKANAFLSFCSRALIQMRWSCRICVCSLICCPVIMMICYQSLICLFNFFAQLLWELNHRYEFNTTKTVITRQPWVSRGYKRLK